MPLILHSFQQEALKILGSDLTRQAHVICIAPTGSGKSLIYERAAAVEGRRTLLITPLIALARQQFQKLSALGVPVSLGAGESKKLPPPPRSGAWIVSPEMLPTCNTQTLWTTLSRWTPNFLVVDECHCLWDWGETFRPAFLRIPPLLERYPIPQSLWLTATLPPGAKNELKTLLPAPVHEVGYFDLPQQLRLNMVQVSWRHRNQALLCWLSTRTHGILIFVATRAMTVRLARLLEHTKKSIQVYHGGLSSEERKNIEIQVRSEGPQIVIATSAFGMGMDYAHLKHVLLWQSPASILSLVQSIGRVGRDHTASAEATVFWDDPDFALLEWTLGHSHQKKQDLMDLGNFYRSNDCRRTWLHHYFQDSRVSMIKNIQPCMNCDRCTLPLNSSMIF